MDKKIQKAYSRHRNFFVIDNENKDFDKKYDEMEGVLLNLLNEFFDQGHYEDDQNILLYSLMNKIRA